MAATSLVGSEEACVAVGKGESSFTWKTEDEVIAISMTSMTDPNRSNLILTSLAGEAAANEVYDRMFSVQAVRKLRQD